MSKINLNPSLLEGVYGGNKYYAVTSFDKTKPYSFVGVRGPMKILFNPENRSQVFEIINVKALAINIEDVDPDTVEYCYTWPEFLAFAAKKHNINS